ncbi:unnamed protein product [Dracunculus medinensis]|uniref:Transmembrane protein n=1 Tax=Dracunculus medinensis TaxID=318479 RepID=A0A0N4UDA1_DRAME|nr:unnamed protein product [Dracunculus medinensis]
MSDQRTWQGDNNAINFNIAILLTVTFISVGLLVTSELAFFLHCAHLLVWLVPQGIIIVAIKLDPSALTAEDDDVDCDNDDVDRNGSDIVSQICPMKHAKVWPPGISAPSGRIMPHFDTLSNLQLYSNP